MEYNNNKKAPCENNLEIWPQPNRPLAASFFPPPDVAGDGKIIKAAAIFNISSPLLSFTSKSERGIVLCSSGPESEMQKRPSGHV
jgi:hypothetical protein